MLVFVEGGKVKNQEKALEQGESQKQIQTIYATRPDLNVDHVDGRCHSCFLEERERGDCDETEKVVISDNSVP